MSENPEIIRHYIAAQDANTPVCIIHERSTNKHNNIKLVMLHVQATFRGVNHRM